jgi:hypothetical protein
MFICLIFSTRRLILFGERVVTPTRKPIDPIGDRSARTLAQSQDGASVSDRSNELVSFKCLIVEKDGYSVPATPSENIDCSGKTHR